MKLPLTLIMIVAIGVMASCDKSKKPSGDPARISDHPAQPGASASGGGEVVRAAAKDHTLPPYIQESAATLVRTMDGKERDSDKVMNAIRELAATRSEKTCRIWISLVLQCEAGLPAVLPSLEEMTKLEKENPGVNGVCMDLKVVRCLALLGFGLKYLTQFDMPEADREVAGLMKRFETRYGGADLGKFILEGYRSEISNATEDRRSGAVMWKLGHEGLHNLSESE